MANQLFAYGVWLGASWLVAGLVFGILSPSKFQPWMTLGGILIGGLCALLKYTNPLLTGLVMSIVGYILLYVRNSNQFLKVSRWVLLIGGIALVLVNLGNLFVKSISHKVVYNNQTVSIQSSLPIQDEPCTEEQWEKYGSLCKPAWNSLSDIPILLKCIGVITLLFLALALARIASQRWKPPRRG